MTLDEIMDRVAAYNVIRGAIDTAARDKQGRHRPETRYMDLRGFYKDDEADATPGSLVVEFGFEEPAPYTGGVTVILMPEDLAAIFGDRGSDKP